MLWRCLNHVWLVGSSRKEKKYFSLKNGNRKKESSFYVVYKFIKASFKHTSNEYMTSTGKCFIIVIKIFTFFLFAWKKNSKKKIKHFEWKTSSYLNHKCLTFSSWIWVSPIFDGLWIRAIHQPMMLYLLGQFVMMFNGSKHSQLLKKNVIYFIWCIDSGSRTMFNELNKHYFGGKFVYAITFWMPNFF